MSEFQSRIAAQRRVLEIVNTYSWSEQLMGLSRRSIDRWMAANRVGADSETVRCLVSISAKLFFLSNKSQQQVTEEYRSLQREVSALTQALAATLAQPSAVV